MSLSPTLLKDINLFASSIASLSAEFTEVNGTAFFQANDATNGFELWKSDGTTAGTALVKNIGGSTSIPPDYLANVNGTLFFTGDNGTNGPELWKSDGTTAGTVLVKDIRSGASGSYPGDITNVNGTAFFVAVDGSNGDELWKSDGTAAGTVLLKDIRPGGSGSYPVSLINVAGTLFFQANDGSNGYELWKSDGTTAGTVLVKDIRPGSGWSYPSGLTIVNGTLFFQANDGSNGYELWKSDGTAAGTVLVKDIRPGVDGSAPGSLTNVSGTLFFQANDGTNGPELWKSDGTAAGTVLVKDIRPGVDGSSPASLANLSGALFFQANDGSNGPELWRSDGAAAGTVLVKDIRPGVDGSSPASLTNLSGTLFFQANDGTNGIELWKSNGSAAGTVLVEDIRPGAEGSDPLNLVNIIGRLFFSADDGATGREPWIIGPFSTVVGRHIFYNQSGFDGNSAAISGPADASAIATDKSAYIPGAGLSVFGNITSYSRGINGIMVDITGSHPSITADDFIFKTGNDNTPSAWATIAPTSVSVIAGGGVSGSDRVEIIWSTNTIRDKWLEVQVLANTDTGMASTDVHFWGNKVADSGTGTPATIFQTTSTDATQVFANLTGSAAITDLRDYNRLGGVTSTDATLVFANIGTLQRIDIGSGGPFAPEGAPASMTDDSGLAFALAVGDSDPVHGSMVNAPSSPRDSQIDADTRHRRVIAVFEQLGIQNVPLPVHRIVDQDGLMDDALGVDDELLDDLVPALA